MAREIDIILGMTKRKSQVVQELKPDVNAVYLEA